MIIQSEPIGSEQQIEIYTGQVYFYEILLFTEKRSSTLFDDSMMLMFLVFLPSTLSELNE